MIFQRFAILSVQFQGETVEQERRTIITNIELDKAIRDAPRKQPLNAASKVEEKELQNRKATADIVIQKLELTSGDPAY